MNAAPELLTCPVCSAAADPIAMPPDAALFAFDATCRACGWHFTSPARRAALLAADAETPSHAELDAAFCDEETRAS